MRRPAALLLITSVLVFAGVAAPAAACACGAPAPMPGYEVDVERESAVVRWEGDLEQITMQLDMRSGASETGLVVPTPNPATVTAGDEDLFDQLLAQIQPREVVEYDWWGASPFDGAGSAGGAPPEVLARVQLGPIEAVTLAASDTAGLTGWLDTNGYALSAPVTAELGQYVDDGWSFVALKLTGDVAFDGELDPITFTFESESLVYPMRMSRAADSPQTVRLYVIGAHRAVVTQPGGAELAGETRVTWAGRVDNPSVAALGEYLTVVDLYFDEPASQITTDLAVSDAERDDEVIPTVTHTEVVGLLGIPAGPLLVVLGIVLLIVLAVLLRSRRTRYPQH